MKIPAILAYMISFIGGDEPTLATEEIEGVL